MDLWGPHQQSRLGRNMQLTSLYSFAINADTVDSIRLDVQATVRVLPAASVSRKHPGSFRRAQTICPAVAKTSLEALEDEGRASGHPQANSSAWYGRLAYSC